MGIPRGLTPTFELGFADQTLDLTEADHVYVTFDGGGSGITKTGTDLEVAAQTIGVYLSQKETLSFPEGPVEIQANWTYPDHSRGGSDVYVWTVDRQLLGEVLP